MLNHASFSFSGNYVYINPIKDNPSWGEISESVARTIFLTEIVRGFSVTLGQMFKEPATINYPFKIWTFNNSIYWASFLTKPTIYTFCHINVIPKEWKNRYINNDSHYYYRMQYLKHLQSSKNSFEFIPSCSSCSVSPLFGGNLFLFHFLLLFSLQLLCIFSLQANAKPYHKAGF